MYERLTTTLQNSVCRLLRLPSEPRTPPLADSVSVRVFRPTMRFYWYQLARTQGGAIIGIWFGIWAFGWLPETAVEVLSELPGATERWFAGDWMNWLEALAVFGFVFQLVVTTIVLRLDLRHRWYLITDRSVRIHAGLWNVEERTMTLANIQTMSIRQGPLQQLFRLSDLKVESAGGGGSSSGDKDGLPSHGLHVSIFRGISNSKQVRELIGTRIRALGLQTAAGPDSPATVDPTSTAMARTIEAAKRVLAEAAALGKVVSSRPIEAALEDTPNNSADPRADPDLVV